MEIITTQFSSNDVQRYGELKDKCKKAWVEFAEAIIEIRDSKLYKIDYETFEQFCQEELNITKAYGHYFISAAEVIKNIEKSTMVDFFPQTERQTRPLTKLEPELQPYVWVDVVNSSDKVTAKKVEEKVEEYKELNEALKDEKKIEINIFNPNPENEQLVERISKIQVLPIEQQIREIQSIAKEIRLAKAEERKEQNVEIKKKKAIMPEGHYGVVVIDPPWEMEKIQRDVAPEQVDFDYPTMNYDEIKELKIPAGDHCHMFCWTTHKHLPATLEIINSWGFKYVLTMTWHKNGGFQPYNLPQYNSEFVVYARKGAPEFSDTKQFFTCFNGKRREHSRKPDEFYEVISRVTEGLKRIDIFSREKRNGWEQFGNETEKFTANADTF